MKLTTIQQAWVDDLMTGKHPQTQGALQDCDGFCCLGRAAAVMGLKFTEFENGNFGLAVPDESDYLMGVLHEAAYKQMGLRSSEGRIDLDHVKPEWLQDLHDTHGCVRTCLTELNDLLKWPFPRIGRFIKENPEAVFA